jgi:carbonic anhydrase
MERRHVLKALAGLALCPQCISAAFAADAHWSYEGHGGPDQWSELDAANRVCSAGAQQSPIDIGDAFKVHLSPLKIAWSGRGTTIVNNGHTIQVNFTDASILTGPGGSFKLVQFHFHHPSEHLIRGQGFPMEAHFVHINDTGGLAVVGVLMATGKPNAVFNKIVSTMPDQEGPPANVDQAIDPHGLLPTKRDYYRYSGSLTTPPCSETVDWLLLTEPIQVAEADVARFAKLYPLNARPTQKVNRRFVLESS